MHRAYCSYNICNYSFQLWYTKFNQRDFHQAELDSDINPCSLFNEIGDLYLYCIILVYKLSALNDKNDEKIVWKDKQLQLKECRKQFLEDANYDLKKNGSRNVFLSMSLGIVHYILINIHYIVLNDQDFQATTKCNMNWWNVHV